LDDVFVISRIIKIEVRPVRVIRDLTQNTTATATGTSPNKRFTEQNNGCARAF